MAAGYTEEDWEAMVVATNSRVATVAAAMAAGTKHTCGGHHTLDSKQCCLDGPSLAPGAACQPS